MRYLQILLGYVRHIISYIQPLTSYRRSLHSGILFITLRNGKKILEATNANYSFASLHRIMNFALDQVEIPSQRAILLLGLGGGSALSIIRDDKKLDNPIIAVDIDPVIIEVAREEFGLDSYADTQIICQDAFKFIKENTRTFGLIIIDLWIDDTVPKQFFEKIFWHGVLQGLSQEGQIIFNMLIETTDKKLLTDVIDFLKEQKLQVETYDKVDKTNWLLIAKKK